MIIGLTGRTATGKTTLASVFRDRGYEVLDADRIYSGLFESCEAMREKLFDEFKTLDRRVIFELVRNDKGLLSKLDSITHPHVSDAIIDKISALGKGKILLDVPIPVERGFLDISDMVVCTTCSRDGQVERLIERYGISKEEALDRMGMQKEPEDYFQIADFIVETENTSREDLEIIAAFIEESLQLRQRRLNDD